MRLKKTREFLIKELYDRFGTSDYYHNVDHSLQVEEVAKTIAGIEGLNDKDVEILSIAALAHDIGHSVSYLNHEEIGCKFIKENIPQFGYKDEEISAICELIMSTKFPHKPIGVMQEIICDADLSYIGTDQYETNVKRLRKEFIEVQKRDVSSDLEWMNFQLLFLQKHQFYRNYSKQEFQMNKNSVIQKLELNIKLY